MSTTLEQHPDLAPAIKEATAVFASILGVADVDSHVETVGNRTFLKFSVGRQAPIYDNALWLTQRQLTEDNPFRGLVNLNYQRPQNFPQSLEASVLQNIITRETRHVAQGHRTDSLTLQSVAFPNHEDQKIIQPASHLIVGRRGVGKSMLIMRASELLDKTRKLCIVIDVQAYAETSGDALYREVLSDFARRLAGRLEGAGTTKVRQIQEHLEAFADVILEDERDLGRAVVKLNRLVSQSTGAADADVFLFLDDYHLLDDDSQPNLLHILHGALKGAGGWLKIAGLRTRLHAYNPGTRKGLQVPGDAQQISLDFTLVDPESAEKHLRMILERFLHIVGVGNTSQAIHDAAFRRLVWANAGVPRDFLQMFARSLEHARRANRSKVTLTDVNLSIGEFGQQKLDELEQDARNEQNTLKRGVQFLERFCLETHKVNGFLVRSEQTPERHAIEVLSDLRLVHLIHQTITPHRAGQRYEAYLIDYSLFTGFRRRPNIRELLPDDGRQFKAKELRQIPELPKGFLAE